MEQSYCLIRSKDLQYVDEILVRTLNLCANPVSSSLLDEDADATASYPGAYGYSYMALKMIKGYLDMAQTYDPSLEPTPF
jgi:hypothetical protein